MATSYANNGSVGYRGGELDIAVTWTAPVGATMNGLPAILLLNGNNGDGSTTNFTGVTAGSDAFVFGNNTVPTDIVFTFDWGPNARICIDAFRWYQSNNTAHGTYVFEYADATLSSWTQLGSSFSLGGVRTSGYIEHTFTNSTGYRAYRIRQTGGANDHTCNCQGIAFQLEDLTPGGPTARTSAFNTDGGLPDQTTSRTGSVTATTTATLSDGTAPNLLNKGVGNNSTDSLKFNGGQSTREIKFDFITARTIDGLCYRKTGTQTQGTWKFAGSNDDSSYTDLVTGIDLTQAHNSYFFANTTAYRYYKLIQTAGTTSSTGRSAEVYFRIKNPAPASGYQPVVITAIGA